MTDYLIKGPVNPELMSRILALPGEKADAGAVSVFIGRVRADEKGTKRVMAIEYSAYDDMVNVEALKIKEVILSHFEEVKFIHFVHSTGTVRAGEISLFVIAAAGHRQQAINSCSEMVELIKERLPVWKKEIFDDDTHEWKVNSSH